MTKPVPRPKRSEMFARAVMWLARHRGEDIANAVELTAHLFQVSTGDVREALRRLRGEELDRMTDHVIIAATMVPGDDGRNTVVVTTQSERGICLFSYFRDELRFTADEFVGKTVAAARAMHHERDVAFLRDEVAAHG